MRCAILDDYQNAALQFGNWASLQGVEVRTYSSHFDDEEALAAAVGDCEILVAMRERTPFPASLFARLPKLKLLVSTGARSHVIDFEAASRHGVAVCATRGNFAPTVEFIWTLLLGLARNLVGEAEAFRAARGWQTPVVGADLNGRRLGLIGLGKIGEKMATIGQVFGMEIVGWSQNLTDERAAACGAVRAPSLDALLETSDFVSLHMVLSERSRRMIGREQLQRMKPTAYLVNAARAGLVDTNALVEALEGGWIAGAAIDVYEEEPLPPDHVLRRTPRLLATPHVAHVNRSSYSVYYADAVEDIRAWLDGTPIRVLTG